MDFTKIAQELNYVDALKKTYSKVSELTNNIETNESNKSNPKFAQAMKLISSWENQFGIDAYKCNNKQTLLKALKSLNSFYSSVTNNLKQQAIKIDNKYDRDLLLTIGNDYISLAKKIV